MDVWLLGEIFGTFDWIIFYYLVYKKVRKRLLNNLTEKKIKIIHEGTKIIGTNWHWTSLHLKKNQLIKLAIRAMIWL